MSALLYPYRIFLAVLGGMMHAARVYRLAKARSHYDGTSAQ